MIMKRLILALSTVAIIGAGGSGLAQASEIGHSKKFGIGGILGQPTGFTLKYHFTPNHALTAAVGFGWWGGTNFHTHVDYGYHFDLTKPEPFDLRMYVGGGVKFFYFPWDRYNVYDRYCPPNDPYCHDNYGRVGIGIRAPVGITFNLNKIPLEIFGELAPGLAFLPWIYFFVDAAVGVRYYF